MQNCCPDTASFPSARIRCVAQLPRCSTLPDCPAPSDCPNEAHLPASYFFLIARLGKSARFLGYVDWPCCLDAYEEYLREPCVRQKQIEEPNHSRIQDHDEPRSAFLFGTCWTVTQHIQAQHQLMHAQAPGLCMQARAGEGPGNAMALQ